MQENSADGARGAAKLAQATPDRDKRARLIVVAGYVVGEMYGLEGTLVIGRGSAADIRIPGEGISRRHARLTSGIFGASTVFMSATQLGHSVVVAQRHYLGVHRGIPKDAQTLEAAMQLDGPLKEVRATVERAPQAPTSAPTLRRTRAVHRAFGQVMRARATPTHP